MRALLILGCLLVATEARAQVDFATVTFAGAAAADWASTHESTKYFREANPVISWLDHKPKAMIALGAGIDVAGVLAWHRLTRNHKRLRAAGLYGAAAARVFIAARNMRIVRGRHHRR
jgi:hypothetical protein